MEATPELPWDDFADWVNVMDYRHLVKNGDWTQAIQAALDTGKATVLFPANQSYRVTDTVRVPASVRRLFGMKNAIQADAKVMQGKPVVRIEGDSDQPLILERLGVSGGQHKPGLEHAAPRPVVIRHGNLSEYRSAPGAGPVFFENVEAVFRFLHPQHIWARHINPETRDIPEIVNAGATLWILGLKTEYTSINIVNKEGARTEVLGGLIYPVEPIPKDLPMFVNDEASLSLICGISAYPHNHYIYVRETRDGKTVDVLVNRFPFIGGRPMIPLYTGYTENGKGPPRENRRSSPD